MKRRAQTRREPLCHADDWLMTYADMITLLLCLFAIFLSISLEHKAPPTKIEIAAAPVSATEQPKDFLEGNLPFHGIEHSDRPTEDRPAAPQAKADALPAPVNAIAMRADTPPVKVDAPSVKADAEPSPRVIAPQPVSPPQTVDTPNSQGPAETEPKGDRITMLEISSSAFFDSGSATLSAAGEAILGNVADKLKSDAFQDYEITVEGHTDDTPIHTAQFPSNWELSTARAAAVLHFLLDQGLPAQKLRAAGYADTSPKVPNRDASGNPIPENQAQNRRVVIELEKIEPAKRDSAAQLGGATSAVPPRTATID